MSDLIRRDDAVKVLRGKAIAKYPNSFFYGLFAAANEILDIPAVDAVEVVHGRWDDSGRYRFPGGSIAVRCTECGCALRVSEYKLNRWNYCPVCGAKMDGGKDNGTE